jgi:hypothetical protein
MEIVMDQKFCTGDRIRHAGRPEWGIGTVTKVEALPVNGQASQRLSIRFPNAGVKTLVTGHAELHRVEVGSQYNQETPTVQYWDKVNDSEWLAPMAKRKIEEAMISLPPDIRDPFNSIQKRLTLMLGLYRFDRSGHGLMDWAVAQTGLDDPLTRFTRQELEQKFDRWCFERDNYLSKLLHEVRTSSASGGNDSAALNAVLKTAPPAAQDIVRRLIANR